MENTISANSGVKIGATTAPSKPKRRIFKKLGYAALIIGALLFVGDLVWTASGSSQWQLVTDKEGVKVWTMKSPGSPLVRVKAEVTIKSSLSSMVKLLEDLDSCVDAFCYDTKVLREVQSMPDNYGKYVRFKFDLPIAGYKTRDYVLFAEHYQDPKTKKLEINIMAAPDMIPRDNCCIRVTHLHNNWKLTPLKNNELNIVFTQDTDIGGMNYPLANVALKEGMYKVLHDMQDLMNKDKYKNAKVDYIKELGQD
jgi:hypothetical protein